MRVHHGAQGAGAPHLAAVRREPGEHEERRVDERAGEAHHLLGRGDGGHARAVRGDLGGGGEHRRPLAGERGAHQPVEHRAEPVIDAAEQLAIVERVLEHEALEGREDRRVHRGRRERGHGAAPLGERHAEREIGDDPVPGRGDGAQQLAVQRALGRAEGLEVGDHQQPVLGDAEARRDAVAAADEEIELAQPAADVDSRHPAQARAGGVDGLAVDEDARVRWIDQAGDGGDLLCQHRGRDRPREPQAHRGARGDALPRVDRVEREGEVAVRRALAHRLHGQAQRRGGGGGDDLDARRDLQRGEEADAVLADGVGVALLAAAEGDEEVLEQLRAGHAPAAIDEGDLGVAVRRGRARAHVDAAAAGRGVERVLHQLAQRREPRRGLRVDGALEDALGQVAHGGVAPALRHHRRAGRAPRARVVGGAAVQPHQHQISEPPRH